MLILAVDDETLMLNMLVETLKNVFSDERYVVMGFDDGKEALEYVSSSEESLPSSSFRWAPPTISVISWVMAACLARL